MAPNMKQVILVAISLVVIATILPLGLGLIAIAGETIVSNISGVERTLADVLDPSVLTLLTVLLPVLAVIGITMYFLPKIGD